MSPNPRILFDAYPWVSGPAPLQRFVRGVVGAWSTRFPDDLLTLSIRRNEADDLRGQLGSAGIRADVLTVPSSARFSAMETRALSRMSDGYDAVITQNFAAPTRGARSSVLVHDAMFVEHPEWFSLRERAHLNGLRRTLRHADVVFTASRTESNRVARVWPEVADRVFPVGVAAPDDLARASQRRPDGVGGLPFILAINRLNIRQNLRRLIDAVLDDPALAGYRLVVVGEPNGHADLGVSPTRRDRVRFLDRIGDPELHWLYAQCAVFALPSLDEGSGLALIEARASGARTAASDIPVFRELGTAEAWFDPLDSTDISAGLRRALAAPRPEDRAIDGWADVIGRMRPAALGLNPVQVGARG